MGIFSKFFGGGGAERPQKQPEIAENAHPQEKTRKTHKYTAQENDAMKNAVAEAYSDTATARETDGKVNTVGIEQIEKHARQDIRIQGSDFESRGQQALNDISEDQDIVEGAIEALVEPLGDAEDEDTSDPDAVAGNLEDLLSAPDQETIVSMEDEDAEVVKMKNRQVDTALPETASDESEIAEAPLEEEETDEADIDTEEVPTPDVLEEEPDTDEETSDEPIPEAGGEDEEAEQPAPATIQKVEGGSGNKEIIAETEAPNEVTDEQIEKLTEAKLKSWVAKVEAGMSLEDALEVIDGSIEDAGYAVEDAQADGNSALVNEKQAELDTLKYVRENLEAAIQDKAA